MLFSVVLFFWCIATSSGQYGLFGNYGPGMNYPADPFASSLYGALPPPIGIPLPPVLPEIPPPDTSLTEQRDCRGLPSMRARSICRYANPTMMMLPPGNHPFMNYPTAGCTDMSPQCAVWASTGQCSTNPLIMRSTCALSCGTCSLGSNGIPSTSSSSSSLYNPFAYGMTGLSGGLGAYPSISPFMGRSIYETGLLRQPDISSKIAASTQQLLKSGYNPQ